MVAMSGDPAQTLRAVPVADRPDLLADPVAAALTGPEPVLAAHRVLVAEIDADLADTAAFCAAYGVPPSASANCVLVAGTRAGQVRHAACVLLATTRLDVNGLVRRRLDARRASFATMQDAVQRSGMEYGGITPVGLPREWLLLVDAAVVGAGEVVIGSGLRRSKLLLDGAALADLPGAEVVEQLARQV